MFLLIAALFFVTPPAVRLDVNPRVTMIHSEIRVRVWVPRNPLNRWLRVVAEGPDRVDWTTQIDGEFAPVVFSRYLGKTRPLAPGRYVVVAEVTRNDNTTERDTSSFRIIGPFDREEE